MREGPSLWHSQLHPISRPHRRDSAASPIQAQFPSDKGQRYRVVQQSLFCVGRLNCHPVLL